MKWFLTIISFLTISHLYAATIGCSHPQVCNIINTLLDDSSQARLLKKMGSDPHHDSLRPAELKAMLSVDYLILPPSQLQPWVQQILTKRSKPTFILHNLYKNFSQLYPQLTVNRAAHFWLYPEMICTYIQQIEKKLKQWQLPYQPYRCQQEKIIENFGHAAQCGKDMTIILSHTAAIPLLKRFKFNTLAARASGHGQSLTGQQIKSIINQITANPRVLWILERHITLPKSIGRLQSSHHKQIEMDTLGSIGHDPTFILKKLSTLLVTQLCSTPVK